MSRKICIVTGTRAEYGLLRWVMEGIQQAPELELQIIATGMHLSPEFGLTYQEIEKDGFRIDRKVEMLLSSDTPAGLAKSMGLGLISFGDILHELQPDLMLVLGDRFEIFSAVTAAMLACIPIAHLHGGEATEGQIDEFIEFPINFTIGWHHSNPISGYWLTTGHRPGKPAPATWQTRSSDGATTPTKRPGNEADQDHGSS